MRQLYKRPRLGSLAKLTRFLSLRDRKMLSNGRRQLALMKGRRWSSVRRRRRNAADDKDHGDGDDDDDDDEESPSPRGGAMVTRSAVANKSKQQQQQQQQEEEEEQQRRGRRRRRRRVPLGEAEAADKSEHGESSSASTLSSRGISRSDGGKKSDNKPTGLDVNKTLATSGFENIERKKKRVGEDDKTGAKKKNNPMMMMTKMGGEVKANGPRDADEKEAGKNKGQEAGEDGGKSSKTGLKEREAARENDEEERRATERNRDDSPSERIKEGRRAEGEAPQPPLAEIQRGLCPFSEGFLLIFDDIFTSSTASLNSDPEKIRQQKNIFDRTLNFLSALTTKLSHHLQLHIIFVSQVSLPASGTSTQSRALRTIRANLDAIVIFPQSLRDVRNLLSSLFQGRQYTFVRNLYLETVENSEVHESPADQRLHRPYLCVTLNPHSNQSLRFR